MSSSPPTSTSTSPPPFKLDIGCVEKDEDRAEFLQACSKLDLRTIRNLLDVKGVDINSQDEIGQNCLHYIVCSAEHDIKKQLQLLGYLTAKGANANAARSTDLWTPIFLAVIFAQGQLVSALISNGAKIRIVDDQEMTPEDWAIKYRLSNVKDLLVHGRSRVPHSRFSCVQQGPALAEPTSPSSSVSEEPNSATSEPNSASSESNSASSESNSDVPVATNPIGDGQEKSEACLLTAQ